MKNAFQDPLLLAGKVAAILMQAAMAIGAVALIVGAGALLFFQDKMAAEMRAELADPNAVLPVLPLLGILVIGFAIVAMLFVFFGRLRQIIATVGEGDPFVPDNARRLSLMAWLMLGIHLLMLPGAAIGMFLAQFADEVGDADMSIDGGLDLSGILLVIILFILARVFRHGAAMREDLEGTV